MRKVRVVCFIIMFVFVASAVGDRAPSPYLWEWVYDACHHPIGVCSGSPPPVNR